jgi:GMP synthase (glutamine-hydrolysing)
LLVVRHADDDPPARLGEWLAMAGAELDVRSPYLGDPLPSMLTDHAGLVVLGGSMGAYDDEVAPWLPSVRALLSRAVGEEVPTLGICLGAQLLAVSAGGRVARGADGPELGAHLIAKRTAAAVDPLLQSLPITPDVIQWHHDVITALPPGAVLLASSPMYEVQAFRVGRLAWGLQGHIETTPEIVRRWADHDPYVADYDLSKLLERSDAVHPDIAETWQPIATRFVEIVDDPDSVRAARGPTVSTAAPIEDPAAIRAALAAELQASRGPVGLGLPTFGGGSDPYGRPSPADPTDAETGRQ